VTKVEICHWTRFRLEHEDSDVGKDVFMKYDMLIYIYATCERI